MSNWVICVYFLFRSLGQVSLLFGHAVRGMTAGSRIFEVVYFCCRAVFSI